MSGSAATTQHLAPSHVGEPHQTGLGLPPWISRGSVLMVFLAVLMPAALPLLMVGLPALALVTVWRLKTQDDAKAGAAETQAPELVQIGREGAGNTGYKRHLSVKKEDSTARVPARVDTAVVVEDAGVTSAAVGPPAAATTGGQSGQSGQSGQPDQRAAVGGAAILAKLRAAKQQKPVSGDTVVVTYASQTGTAAEVAKNIGSSIESEPRSQ